MGSFQVEDRLNPALLANFDVYLHTFYLKAIARELDICNRKNVRAIKTALKVVVEAYKLKNDCEDIAKKSLRFDSSAKRCSYVLKHSTCFTSAVARHVLGSAMEFPEVFSNAMQLSHSQVTPTFNVCCLGGGPASDAVGICKVLSAFCRLNSIRNRLKLKVTVVDINEDWIATARNVLETLNDAHWMYGIELSFEFFQADLTKPFEKEVKKVLGSADVVTMVYFLSAVNQGKDSIESFQMIKEIMKCMRNNGVLFFLDSATDVHYNQMSSAAESLDNMLQVYGPRIEEFHSLSLDSVRKFLDLHKKHFGKFLCLTNCFVSSSAWCKLSIPSLESNYRPCNVAVERFIVLDRNEEYADKSHVVLLNKPWSTNCFLDEHSTLKKSITLNGLKENFLLRDKLSLSKNLREDPSYMDKSFTINNLEQTFWPVEKFITVNNFEDKFWLSNKPMHMKNLDDNSRIVNKAVLILQDETSKLSINCPKENDCKPLAVGRIRKKKFSYFNQDKDLVHKNSQRQVVSRLTAKMLKYRAQVDRLLADEFEQFHMIDDGFDEIDYPSDDTFDCLLNEYIHFVPKFFFQTKSKKRRIFTEWI